MNPPKLYIYSENPSFVRVLLIKFTKVFPCVLCVHRKDKSVQDELSVFKPDAILVDVSNQAYDLLDTINSTLLLGNAPVLALSNNKELNEMDKIMQFGASDYIQTEDPRFIDLLCWSLQILLRPNFIKKRMINNTKRRVKPLLWLLLTLLALLLLKAIFPHF